jgi:hypothetical protein
MAYQVHWIVENRVLYISLSDQLALADIRESSLQIADLMDEAYKNKASLVIGIVDMRDANLGSLVRSFVSSAVQEISTAVDSRLWKAKPGFIVMITTSDAAKTLTSLVIRLSSQPLTTVGTLAEAITVVSYMYPELQAQLNAYRDNDSSAEKTS